MRAAICRLLRTNASEITAACPPDCHAFPGGKALRLHGARSGLSPEPGRTFAAEIQGRARGCHPRVRADTRTGGAARAGDGRVSRPAAARSAAHAPAAVGFAVR